MRTITSAEAETRLSALLAEVEHTGQPVIITNHGRPVAVLSAAQATPRTFGKLPKLFVPKAFDDPLPADELVAWEPAP